MVYVAASADGYVVGEELEGDYFEDREEEFGGLGDLDRVLYQVLDLFVAFDRNRDDAAAASGYFLNVAQGFFVLQHARWVVRVFCRDADYREGLVDEGVGAVLHLAGGVTFGVDVGDLLELERAFKRDWVVDAAAKEEEVVGGVEDLSELEALVVYGAEDVFDFAGEFAELVY